MDFFNPKEWTMTSLSNSAHWIPHCQETCDPLKVSGVWAVVTSRLLRSIIFKDLKKVANDKRIRIHFSYFWILLGKDDRFRIVAAMLWPWGNKHSPHWGCQSPDWWKEPGTLLTLLIWWLMQPRNCLPPSFLLSDRINTSCLSLKHFVIMHNFFAH